MRGQEHRPQRRPQLVGHPARRRQGLSRDRYLVLGDARDRVERPPGKRRAPAGREHAPPEFAGGFGQRVHGVLDQCGHRAPPRAAGVVVPRNRRDGWGDGGWRAGGQGERVERGHLPSGVAAPPFVRRDLLALHEEGVGGEDGTVAHGHPVMDHGGGPNGAARADGARIGLEGVVLLRVALDVGAGVEGDVVADRHDVLFRHPGAVVEQPPADPDAEQPPGQGLERCAVQEPMHVGPRTQLEEALGAPEVELVDRAVLGPHSPEPGRGTLDQREVHDREQHDDDAGHRDARCAGRVVEVRRGQADEQEREEVEPARQQEQPDAHEVVAVLGGEPAREVRAVRQVDEPAVTLHRSGDLEARRSEEPDALPHRPRDRHQDLRREEAVLARLALRRVDDVVAEEAPGPDGRPGHAERRARVVGVDDRYPAGTHRSAADRAQVRVVVLDLGAEVRPGLHHGGQPVSEALQVVDDVGAVAEELVEELPVGHPRDQPVERVLDPVQRTDLVGAQGEVQQPGDGRDHEEADQHPAGEQHERGHQQHLVEGRAGESRRPGTDEHGEPWDLGEQHGEPAEDDRQGHAQEEHQLQERVAGSAPGRAVGRIDPLVVRVRGLAR